MSIHLNEDWRVVRDEEESVYSLQQREGDGWITRAKAAYRNQLLRRIGDWCGNVSEDSLKEITIALVILGKLRTMERFPLKHSTSRTARK